MTWRDELADALLSSNEVDMIVCPPRKHERPATCRCDRDYSSTVGICDVCGRPDPTLMSTDSDIAVDPFDPYPSDDSGATR